MALPWMLGGAALGGLGGLMLGGLPGAVLGGLGGAALGGLAGSMFGYGYPYYPYASAYYRGYSPLMGWGWGRSWSSPWYGYAMPWYGYSMPMFRYW